MYNEAQKVTSPHRVQKEEINEDKEKIDHSGYGIFAMHRAAFRRNSRKGSGSGNHFYHNDRSGAGK